jgi:DNA-binding NarL/FixJ family response regulator
MIRVLIADDHALVREGIRYVLDLDPNISVVAEASNGREAIDMALEHNPDVVVLDINMPLLSGLEAAAQLRQLTPDTRLLLLSMHDQAEYAREGLRIGTHGYILKDSAGKDLRDAIHAVHAGETFLSPAIADRLREAEDEEVASAQVAQADGDSVVPNTAARQLEQLTPRERDVLSRIARGLTNKAIAAELGISRRTVEAHRESLMRKLGIHSVAGLTRLALEVGLDTGA